MIPYYTFQNIQITSIDLDLRVQEATTFKLGHAETPLSSTTASVLNEIGCELYQNLLLIKFYLIYKRFV